MSKTDGGTWLCLCVGNESISFTRVPLPSRGGRVGAVSCVACLFASSLFSHMLVPFCLYCSLSHLSHGLPATVFASEPSSSTACLYLPVIAWPYSCSQYLHFLLFCLFLSPERSVPHSLTRSAPVYYRSIWPFHYVAFKNHPEKGDRNRRSTAVARFLACIWCNDPKPKLLLLL